MFVRSLSLLVMISLLGCGSPANPPPPTWTVENPNASSAKPVSTAAQKPAAGSKGGAGGSLDDLQKGQSTATSASSPLKDVFFGFDRYDLTTEARAVLKANADWLKANSSAQIQIEGHCDERGTVEYNLALGSKRAQASKDYLATLGIAANRLSVISYGEEIPVCKDGSESCWIKNRRARFVVSTGRPTS